MIAGVEQRRREVVVAGHSGDSDRVTRYLDDEHSSVRVAALGALERCEALDAGMLTKATNDPDLRVRRRAAELCARRPEVPILPLLDDDEPMVVEVAAFACGEREAASTTERALLRTIAADHEDALCREAAVAALGAIGDPDGLATILGALGDKATVRRRAVIALAPFVDRREVEEAVRGCLDDRDWQVRQAAEDLFR